MQRLIGVGDNTVDTYVYKRTRFPGGNAVNVAVLAKRYGIDSAYLGAIGGDECGELILSSLNVEGVDISHCKKFNDVHNAFAEVDIVNGERVFGDYSPGAAELLKLTQEDYHYIESFDLVHTSIYSHLEDQMEALRKVSKFLSFDFSNHLDEMGYIQRMLPFVDMAIFSMADHPDIQIQPFAQAIYLAGVKIIVITQGRHGSWVFDGANLYHQDVIKTDVVDTMGAGDAYIAAFGIEYLRGVKIREGMRKAAQFAAEVCKYEGGFGYCERY